MVEAGLLRYYLGNVLKSSKVKKVPLIEHRTKSVLTRASRLRSGAAKYLSKEKLESRIKYWTDKDKGYLKEEMQWIEEEEENALIEKKQNESGASGSAKIGGGADDDEMPDPMAMMGPMKGQFAFMAQNMILMQGIGYFFSGYVLVKVPIPLTNGFKMMFQRGLDLSTLETSYVSSVSWYFLVMFGLRAFFKLVIDGNGNAQQDHMDAAMLHQDMGNTMSAGGPAKKFDSNKALKMEIENLELTKVKSALDDADRRLLGKKYFHKKISSGAGGGKDGNNPGYDIFGAGSVPTKGGSGRSKKSGKGKVKAS